MPAINRIATVSAALLASLLGLTTASAQASASFKLTESVLNAGGDPQNGTSASSASFHIKLAAIGDAVSGVALASAGFRSDAGFVGDYRPPGEIIRIYFSSKTSMTWDPEGSVGVYEVYREALSNLPAGFGTCFASGLASELATDASTPPAGQGWFYLVTARNRLGEEGTKGFETSGAERPNLAPCP